MPLDVTPLNDATVVMIPPRFDAANAPGIEADLKAMLDGKPRKVIFDFTETDYIASAGLRVLLLITRDLMKAGAKVALVELRPTVHKVFDMAGFTSIFLICVSREEAIRKMS
jgi:stage II sporulation protein AA (anti-sigma F factor antagonist)